MGQRVVWSHDAIRSFDIGERLLGPLAAPLTDITGVIATDTYDLSGFTGSNNTHAAEHGDDVAAMASVREGLRVPGRVDGGRRGAATCR